MVSINTKNWGNKKYTRLINEVEDYIEQNLDKKILLRDIAKSVCLSEYHLHRIFSKYTSESIHQFIARIKLERSAILLIVNQNLSITEIAYMYGYSESSAYCRAFKRCFQVSPSQYRKARNVKIL